MTEPMPFEIDVEDLDRWTKEGASPKILDVREPWEVAICSFKGSINIPMRELPGNLERLPDNEDLVVICHHGVRSLHVMSWLRNMGFQRATSLRGGIKAWAQRIDPTMNTY